MKHRHATRMPLFLGNFLTVHSKEGKVRQGGSTVTADPSSSGALYTQLGRARRPGAYQCILFYTRSFNCRHKKRVHSYKTQTKTNID